MRSYLLFVCVALAVFVRTNAGSSDLSTKKVEAAKACENELNLPSGFGSILQTETIPTEEQQKCFLECVYGKLGFLKDGKLHRAVGDQWIKQRFPNNPEAQKKIVSAFEACDKIVVADPNEKCSIGRLLRECIFNTPEGAPLKAFTKSN